MNFYRTYIENEKFHDIPLIFITAKTRSGDKMKGLKEGAVDYLFKPFSHAELKHKIFALLRFRQLQKALFDKDKFATLGRLVGGISHELLNPLSAISYPMQNLEAYNLSTLGKDVHILKYIEQVNKNIDKIVGNSFGINIINIYRSVFELLISTQRYTYAIGNS